MNTAVEPSHSEPDPSRLAELEALINTLRQDLQAREALAGSMQVALDAVGMGSWQLDCENGTIERSARHDQILGAPLAQEPWTVETTLQCIYPTDRPRVRQAFLLACSAGAIDVEARLEGSAPQRWIHLSGRTFYLEERAVRIVGVIADVTQRHAADERLHQAQKIEALGQLTGGLAHDFNNLLQIILGGLQMLNRQSDAQRRERTLNAMKQAAERAAGLCRQLLAFSRRQALNPDSLDVKVLLRGMQDLLMRSLPRNIDIQPECAADLWPIEADASELELVLLNLALNARDAMPHGGILKLCATNQSMTDSDLYGDFVRIDVSDTGCGMAPEVLAHAFEPFFTTKAIGQGSGLGLAQAHGFASASHGGARIASRAGHGTVVSLYLPRTAKMPKMVHSVATSEPATERPGGQVLLVEDDDEVAALTAEMIEELGYATTRVANAEAALGALAERRTVDIVFSDVMMPGRMNGVELAAEIRRRRPNLPVLLTSGYAEQAARDAAVSHINIIPKPFKMDQLRDALAAAKQDARKFARNH